jgi:hypothetical protein
MAHALRLGAGRSQSRRYDESAAVCRGERRPGLGVFQPGAPTGV